MTVPLYISYRSWCHCVRVHVFLPFEVLDSVCLFAMSTLENTSSSGASPMEKDLLLFVFLFNLIPIAAQRQFFPSLLNAHKSKEEIYGPTYLLNPVKS